MLKVKLGMPLLILFFIIACSKEEVLNGYIEGEYIYISATTAGTLQKIYVKKGDTISQNQALYELDTTILKSNLELAQLNIKQAEDQYSNLLKGKRPQELDVIKKQLKQAEFVLDNAKKDYERYKQLIKNNFISKSDLDDKQTNYNVAKSKVEELKASLKVAQLGARAEEVKTAEINIELAKQKYLQAKKVLDEAMPIANTTGSVQDVYYKVGEFISTGSPVLSILPDNAIKVRFFVNQKQLPNIGLNQNIKVKCDGCSEYMDATISFISNKAEFTPPIIYSLESRDKLVFMVEAVLPKANNSLKPGLPVSVVLLSADK